MDPTTKEEGRQARADNARLIMSNSIPPNMATHEQPYCIWYPELASEDTYRKLAQQFPDMRYQVGRACAVGRYLDLYSELDLLPEVSIAEEARDSGADSIYEAIIAAPLRYAILDDYTCSVNLSTPRCPAFLNGDTAVCSILKVKEYSPRGRIYFNITEDSNVPDGEVLQRAYNPLALEHVPLLYSPLPPDLPTINKDVLILMAAYEGNIDRYVRLRRPVMIPDELEAVLRGIYHSTTFARWWSMQPVVANSPEFQEAITARFIMVNDLSRLTPSPDLAKKDRKERFICAVPFLIWWPLFPAEDTLRELLRLRPSTIDQVAITCAIADYRMLWNEIVAPAQAKIQDLRGLWTAAARRKHTESHNPYTEDVERWAKEKGIKSLGSSGLELETDKEPTCGWVAPEIYARRFAIADDTLSGIYYWGSGVNAAAWETYIAVEDEVRVRARDAGLWVRSWREEEEEEEKDVKN